jgi:hypothetical protein
MKIKVEQLDGYDHHHRSDGDGQETNDRNGTQTVNYIDSVNNNN